MPRWFLCPVFYGKLQVLTEYIELQDSLNVSHAGGTILSTSGTDFARNLQVVRMRTCRDIYYFEIRVKLGTYLSL
jgi:hypothetical protein